LGTLSPNLNADKSAENRASGKVVTVVILLVVVGYLAVVLFNEELRRDYFVQRLTVPILVLAITVILFRFGRSVAVVQIPLGQVSNSVVDTLVTLGIPQGFARNTAGVVVSLGGAAAFFWFVLPPITGAIFPKDQVISGNIYYKLAAESEGLRPVPNVVVQVPETDQRSRPTSDDGHFVITDLSFRPRELNAEYRGLVYPFDPGKYQYGRYDVIPMSTKPRPTAPSSAAATDWIPTGNKCPDVNTSGYSGARLFVFQKTLSTPMGYDKMVIRVSAQDPARIIDAQKEKPDSLGAEDQLQEDRTVTRQWSVPVQGKEAEVKLTVCLGQKGRGAAPARNSLTVIYWFE